MRGAAILAATAVIVKIISGLYKLPLYSMLDDNTAGYYQVAYNIYMLLFAISTAGIPIALSRLVSAASAIGDKRLVKRYFAVSLPVFALLGLILMVLVFLFADNIAVFQGSPDAAEGIRILAPAVFFGCVIAVYRGYMQGHGKMLPTAVSQLIEVICKAGFGLAIAWYLISNGFAKSIISAGAIAGVAVGLGLGIPVMIYYKRKMDRALHMRNVSNARATHGRKDVLLQIFRVSIPITLSSAFISLMTNIDTKIVNARLVTGAGFGEEEAGALYGVYAKGLSFLNLSSALIVPIAVSIIPAIAAAIIKNRQREAREITESALKLTNLLAMPTAVGLSVLAYPIYTVLLGPSEIGPTLLSIFGIASYFIGMQLITTAILQSYGFERIPIFSFLVGGLIQVVIDYVLVGNPAINIVGSPVGTVSCYLTITLINLIFIVVKVRNKPRLAKVFLKPLLSTLVMGVATWAVYELLFKIGVERLGEGRLGLVIYMTGAIIAGIIVYGVLIIATKAITREDMKLIPKGEKIANLLKIK